MNPRDSYLQTQKKSVFINIDNKFILRKLIKKILTSGISIDN